MQHPVELRAVTVVPGCHNEREGSASSVGDEVDFGGEAAAGASQAFADLTTSSRSRHGTPVRTRYSTPLITRR